ncbi:MAG TPA: hypothetical protein VLY23_18455 [Candidatus Acidoferrum sp.]|nr:hypothetical protein [Candidatus Acidoferrum sp.]
MRRIAVPFAFLCVFSGAAFGQGSQRQSVAVSLQGTPIPGAVVWTCQSGSTPSYSAAPPCTLANIYSDPSLGSQFLIAQPLVSDGLGNYTYYAQAGTYVEVITGSNTTGYSSTVVLPCAPNSTASGCSGGAGNPAGSDTQIQINNHSQFGAVSGLAVDSSTSPAVVTIPFSESVKGPRPWVDATAYGADPSGVVDSTTALTSAAAAACNAGSSLYIPPGTYNLTQPQSPSTAPVIPIPCTHIHITALGDQSTTQAEQPPQAKLVVAVLGSNPNAAAVLAFKYATNAGGITIENIQISGYNQALSFYAVTTVSLNNVCATAQSTGLADNTPLKLTNVTSFRMTYGCLNSGSTSLPMALFTGEAPLGSEAPLVGFLQMEHVRGTGGNFQYIQRVNTSGTGPGNFVFDDVTPTGSATDFLVVTNATGNLGQTAMPQFGPVFFLNSSLPNATGSGALINFNSSGSNLTGVHVYSSSASQQATPLIAVRMTAGSLEDCEVHGSVGALVEDGSGNTVGSCSIETRGGLDFLADSTISSNSRLRSEITTGANPTPNLRFYLSPNTRASYGLDAGQGFLLNDGTSNGFNASLAETVKGSIDVQFANLVPPTNVSGSATTGGTIPPGTYYPFVATASFGSCATVSAPSIAGVPVTLSGSNNAVTVTWVLPPQGVASISGYCAAIASSAANANAGLSYASQFASGSGTTSVTITAVAGSMQFPMANAMSPVHRFTTTGLDLTGGLNFYADTGTANTYAVTTSPSITTISLGTVFNFQAAHANTGASTLNVDAIGAIAIKKNGGTGAGVGSDLASGDIAQGQIVTLMFDGTNFQMQSTLGNPAGAGGGGGADQGLSNLTNPTAANQSVSPGTANTYDLGTTPLPWRYLYIGNAANQAAQLDASFLTGNRDIKLPDAAGTLMETTTSATCGQQPALTGDVTTSAGSCATTVAKIQGTTVTVTSPVQNQILQVNGSGAIVNQAAAQTEDAQTGTTYTIPNTDGGVVVTQTNAGAITDTVPDGTEAGFGQGFFFVIFNGNAPGGSQITVNRHTSAQFSFNGALVNTFYVAPQQHAYLYCYDGTNWRVFLQGTGVSGVLFSKAYASQSGSLGSVTMYTAPANGGYRFTAAITCDSATATTATFTLAYTDTSNTSQTLAPGSAAACTSLGAASTVSLSTMINVKSGSTIAFTTTAVGSTYDFRAVLEGVW